MLRAVTQCDAGLYMSRMFFYTLSRDKWTWAILQMQNTDKHGVPSQVMLAWARPSCSTELLTMRGSLMIWIPSFPNRFSLKSRTCRTFSTGCNTGFKTTYLTHQLITVCSFVQVSVRSFNYHCDYTVIILPFQNVSSRVNLQNFCFYSPEPH